MKVEFSPSAQSDLTEIALFIAQDNPTRAASFVGELEKKCEVLAMAPHIGTARPELGEDIWLLLHRRYSIFYRIKTQCVRIERILHSARDIGGGDFEE